MTEPVELVPYDPEWPRLFQREAARIHPTLPGSRIEHVGSTSVPGLAAKPFIDIVAVLDDGQPLSAAVGALQSISYDYVPEAEAVVPERRFFRRLDRSPGFHVHVVAVSAALWSNLLLFRDALRSDPSLAAEYAKLKRELAQLHAADVEAYTVAKGPYVEAATRAARARSRGEGSG